MAKLESRRSSNRHRSRDGFLPAGVGPAANPRADRQRSIPQLAGWSADSCMHRDKTAIVLERIRTTPLRRGLYSSVLLTSEDAGRTTKKFYGRSKFTFNFCAGPGPRWSIYSLSLN